MCMILENYQQQMRQISLLLQSTLLSRILFQFQKKHEIMDHVRFFEFLALTRTIVFTHLYLWHGKSGQSFKSSSLSISPRTHIVILNLNFRLILKELLRVRTLPHFHQVLLLILWRQNLQLNICIFLKLPTLVFL